MSYELSLGEKLDLRMFAQDLLKDVEILDIMEYFGEWMEVELSEVQLRAYRKFLSSGLTVMVND